MKGLTGKTVAVFLKLTSSKLYNIIHVDLYYSNLRVY